MNGPPEPSDGPFIFGYYCKLFAILTYLALIGSFAAGVLAVLKFNLDDPRRLKLVTAFTDAYLMALTYLHLIPEAFGSGPHHHGDYHPF